MSLHTLSQLVCMPVVDLISLIVGDGESRFTINVGLQAGSGYASFDNYDEMTVEVLDKSGRWDKAVFSKYPMYGDKSNYLT